MFICIYIHFGNKGTHLFLTLQPQNCALLFLIPLLSIKYGVTSFFKSSTYTLENMKRYERCSKTFFVLLLSCMGNIYFYNHTHYVYLNIIAIFLFFHEMIMCFNKIHTNVQTYSRRKRKKNGKKNSYWFMIFIDPQKNFVSL